MRNALGIVGVISVVIATALFSGCQQQAQQPTMSPVEHGKYLVNAGGCNHCHTPKKMGPHGPVPDESRLLMGHPAGVELPPPAQLTDGWIAQTSMDMTAWAGPWGISYAANLTPDEETGIGAWDEAMFLGAMRSGLHLGAGRPILPPMPWEDIGHMTDADLKAMFAYFKSVPPIRNEVPEAMTIEPSAAGGAG